MSLLPPYAQDLLDREAIDRILRRMAMSIVEATADHPKLFLVGIRRGGVPLASRIASAIAEIEGREVPVGSVDIALYRDDAATALPDPKIGPSSIPFDVTGAHVVLVDDVLQTGRTVRAAIDCLQDHGRTARIWLAVLCDRGGRELPIAADFVGRELEIPARAKLELELDDALEPHLVALRMPEGES